MSNLIATIKEIQTVDSLNIVNFDFFWYRFNYDEFRTQR